MTLGQTNVGIRIGPSKPKPKIRIGTVRRSEMPAPPVAPEFSSNFDWWLNGAPVMGSTVTFDYALNGGPLAV